MSEQEHEETDEAEEAELGQEAPAGPGEEDGGEESDEEPAALAAPAPKSEKEIEKALSRLDSERFRHAKRVGEIIGDDAVLLSPCPMCGDSLAGWLFPHEPQVEQISGIHARLGVEPEPEYAKAEDARACDKCHALGKVLTGSAVPEHRTKLCAGCQGAGWVLVAGPAPNVVQISAAGAGQTTPGYAEGSVMPPDAWQRPWGHPDYGTFPEWVAAR